MICAEWPREIVTHQIMPRFCSLENIMYCYLTYNECGFFRHRPPQNTWGFFNVYYTPLIELRDKGDGATLCGDLYPTKLHIHYTSPVVVISDDDVSNTAHDITEETTYYALCRHFIDSQSA